LFFALQVKATADRTGLSDAYVRDYFAKKVRPKTTHNFAIPWYGMLTMSHHLTKTGSGQTWRESGTHKEMGFLTEKAGRSRPSAFSRAVLPLRGRLVPLRGRLVLRETAPFNCVIGV
jgi:hypothetical protein